MAVEDVMKLVILDDQVTPYRIHLFEEIGKRVESLRVLYCAQRLKERSWKTPTTLPYEYEILPHGALRLRRPPYGDPRTILVNPTLFFRLLALNPDVVIAYAFSLPAITAFAYAKLLGKGFVSWSTDTLHTERFLGPGQRMVRHLIIPRSDAYVTPSVSGKEKFLHYGASEARIRVAVQSADVAWFAEESTAARQESRTYADQMSISGPCIVYVGFLSDRKGVENLLEAFGMVHQTDDFCHLLLAGDGPRRRDLERRAADLGLHDKVHFPGFVPQSELPGFYASGSVFVLPTLEDTFGVVLSEAAACGLPVVSSKFAGATSVYVQEGVNGHIIDPRTPEKIAEALLDVLEDDQRRIEMGAASLEITRRYPVEKAAEGFAAVAGMAFERKHSLGTNDAK